MEQDEGQWHPTTVFLTGLLHWGGGEGELRRVFEEGVPGCKVKVGVGVCGWCVGVLCGSRTHIK